MGTVAKQQTPADMVELMLSYLRSGAVEFSQQIAHPLIVAAWDAGYNAGYEDGDEQQNGRWGTNRNPYNDKVTVGGQS